MASTERAILDFYRLPTAYPSEWPAEKNDGESSDDEDMAQRVNQRKSRYQALERAVGGRRSFAPNDERSKSGVETLVQADEPDPLGMADSVVQQLTQLGIPLQDNARLRNRFLLSSTTFSPALFLSQMHPNANAEVLRSGLDALTQSIDQKSASLKVLVQSNFERFVRAKATIDNVYKEMRFRGADPAQSRTRPHSRHASRNSFRNSLSGQGLGGSLVGPHVDTRKKNALVKESEYGVMGIKAPLLDVSAKAEEVWGPALGGREKEETLKNVSIQLNRCKEFLELSSAVAESIKRKDYESLVEEYNRARSFADEARRLAETLNGKTLDDHHLCQILIAGRMWYDVGQQVDQLKKDIWKKLVNLHNVSKSENAPGRAQEQHMDWIALLLELGADENPIWIWLLSRYDYLKNKVQLTADRTKVEIELLRRRLAAAGRPSNQLVASHLRSLGRQLIEGKAMSNDSPDVIELWERNDSFLTALLSPHGILGEMIDFWQIAQSFIEGKAQMTLPTGYNGEARKHHQLTKKAVTDLEKGIGELVSLLREHVYSFFSGPPPEDISLLYSPLPPSPNAPAANSPGPASPLSIGPMSSTMDPRFNIDPASAPPPSPKRGEAWEKFAFWPPWSNSISGVYYLSKMLVLVGSGASDMARIGPVALSGNRGLEQLKTLVGTSRERCVTALCAAWNRDAENIKYVEDWQRSFEHGDVTRMPSTFAAFEGALLSGMQKILYISEAMSKPGAEDIVLPPPQKLLQMVRSQYVTTLYKALSGMVENAERPVKTSDEWSTSDDRLAASETKSSIIGKGGVNAADRNIRMLLTLSNLQSLRAQVVPNLNSQFENAFSVKLTDESKTIRDVLGQIDARLFQSYTKQITEQLRLIISNGLDAPDWVPPQGKRPESARPYIYEALLAMVLVHAQVSTTAPCLTPQVVSFLLEQSSTYLLEAFRKRPRYTLEGLMQATLDVEFVAQTLSHYTTDRASELQSQIYQELDSRTDNDARARLQSELPEMRSTLKKLREASKNEFLCFKKPKRPGQAQSRTNSGAAA